MPRVHYVKKARKDNPVAQKGESYYWWKFRFGGKRYSRTYPRPSQLTQSAYFGTLYDLIDMINEYDIELGDEGAVEGLRDEVEGELDSLRDECQGSLDNMPESLQYAPTGELLQERIDALDNAINELSYIEEPDQWQDVRDQMEEHDSWEEDEPDRIDFDDGEDGDDEFEDAKISWLDAEPDVEEFEEFDKFEITELVENCIV